MCLQSCYEYQCTVVGAPTEFVVARCIVTVVSPAAELHAAVLVTFLVLDNGVDINRREQGLVIEIIKTGHSVATGVASSAVTE